MIPSGCTARRYSDQMLCDACGLQWDVNDSDPPACLTEHDRHTEAMRELFADEPDQAGPPPVFRHGVGWE